LSDFEETKEKGIFKSYASKVKEELCAVMPEARHCVLAELSGIYDLCGAHGSDGAELKGDNEELRKKFFTLYGKAFKISGDFGKSKKIKEGFENFQKALRHPQLTERTCCRRAYLRGAFLAAGSVSDPKKSYHLEIVCRSRDTAEKVCGLLRKSGLSAKIVQRKKAFVAYLKEGDEIEQALGEMGAGRSLMDMVNEQIYHEIREDINRRVNCETANLKKTIVSSVRQLEDIRFLQESGRLSGMKPALRQMALLRLENPEATISELGRMADPPVGKSGANHRLRKLSEAAEAAREGSSNL